MNDEARSLRTEQLCRAVARLRETLPELATNPPALDAAIQRFEFCYELSWKALRAHLLAEGTSVANPREAFSRAYVQGWLEDEQSWLAMLADRNRTSHTYDETLARQIGARLPAHADRLQQLALLLSARLRDGTSH